MNLVKAIIVIPGVLGWFFSGVSGQPASAKPDAGLGRGWDTIRVWEETFDLIAADPLDQFYLVRGISVIKYNSSGDSLFSWSAPESGRIQQLDVNDPLRILVYHPDFNQIRYLSNRLTPLSDPVRLDDLGITKPLGICISRQGGIWILDGNSLRIKYFDKQQSLVVESSPIYLPAGFGDKMLKLSESGDRLYVHLPDREIQVFDLFGIFIRKIPLRSSSLEIDGSSLILATGSEISLWKEPVTPACLLFALPGFEILQACMGRNFLLIRLPKKVLLLKPEK